MTRCEDDSLHYKLMSKMGGGGYSSRGKKGLLIYHGSKNPKGRGPLIYMVKFSQTGSSLSC